jgi:hypothetical protein
MVKVIRRKHFEQQAPRWISYNEEGTKTAKKQYNENQKTGKWFFWSGDNCLK